VYILDGTNDSMPDTPELRTHYGVPGGVREGLGFPMSHLLLLLDRDTGLFVDVVESPMFTSDVSTSSRLHARLSPGDILLGDDAYGRFAHLALVLQAGLHLIAPVHLKRIVDFGRGDRRGNSVLARFLGTDDQLVEYPKPVTRPPWMDAEQWQKLPGKITVREIRRTIKRDGFRPIVVTVVTTLPDPVKHPADEVIELRLTRWLIETNIRHLKITLRMDVLKCKSVEGVRKERMMFLLVYNIIRRLILDASGPGKVNVRRMSFADVLAWLRYAKLVDGLEGAGIIGAGLQIKLNPIRLGRLAARVLKRQKKQFPSMPPLGTQRRTPRLT